MTVFLCFASVFLFGVGLYYFQNQMTLGEIRQEMISENDRIRKYYAEAEVLRDSIDAAIAAYMNDALELIAYRSQYDSSFEMTDQYMKELQKTLDVENVVIIDKNGAVKAGAYPVGDYDGDMASLLGVKSLSEVFASDQMTIAGISHLPYEADVPAVQGVYYLYARALNGNYIAIVEDGSETDQYFRDKMDTWSYVLEHEVIGAGGYVFAWSAENNKILYFPDEEFKGKEISFLGIDPQQIEDGQFIWKNIDGTKTYLYPAFAAELNAWVVCACEEKDLFHVQRTVSLIVWIIFAILAGVLAYYEILLLKSREIVTEKSAIISEKNAHFQSRKVRFVIFTLLSAIIIFMSSLYLQTLYRVSDWAKRSEGTVESAKEALAERDAFLGGYPAEYAAKKESLARMISGFLEKNPDRITVRTLNELVERLALVELQVLGLDNNVLAASSNTALQDGATKNAEETDSPVSQVKIVMSDSNDQIMGTLLLSYSTSELDNIVHSQSTNAALRRVQPGEGSYLFSMNRETGLISSHPDAVYIGRSATEYGLSEKQILDNLCSVVVINRKPYYILTGSKGAELLFVAIAESDLLRQRLLIAVITLLAAIVLLNLIGLPLYRQKVSLSYVTREQERSDLLGKGTPEYKAFHALFLFMIAVAAIVSVYSMLNPSEGNTTVLDYVLDGNWEPGLNTFALTSSFVTLCRGCILIFLMRRMAYLLIGIFPIRLGTIIRMLTGLFSYVGAFVVLYICCIEFGMPATALMASAGMVSVVLGIGANSLVGDIIAGMFLLMEGYVQVGDTIEVHGFVGIVQDMGIRVTALYNKGANVVKIIPNREVQNVVHRSLLSGATSNAFLIGFDEDLDRVETLLKEEVAKMAEELKGFDGTPVYQGVSEIAANGVILKIRYMAKEKDRYRLGREINRRVYMMFVRNNIKIPYQQVTLHESDKTN